MQTIYLDVSNRGVIPAIYAKQNDVGRKVEVVLTNSGLPYEPEAGSAFSAWFSGASGVGNYTDIGDKSAFSVSGNKVTVELITQMLQNAGEGTLCLVLSRAGGDQIGLWNIRYICEGIPGAGSEPAKDYYTAFSQAVAGLAYPDASLSVAGKAADAAAVGTALEDKAPAGYGLGTTSKLLTSADNLDNTWQSGNYNWTASFPANAPVIKWDGGYAFMRVDGANANNFTQTVYCGYGDGKGLVVRRVFVGGVTDGWEWKNPPMVLGVEYRTTERCEGKPVYAKRINCLAAPASVSISDLNIEKVVRWSGFVTYYGVALPCSNTGWKVDINRNSISIASAYDQASAHFYIDLYYTKS